jgi:aminobenzoyl-glutamate transport protein
MKGESVEKKSILLKLLGSVEKAGNKLPHPVMLFIYGIILVLVLSYLFSLIGLSVEDPRKVGTNIVIKSLLGQDGLIYVLTHSISNFIDFAPLGTVLVSMLGIGIAERSGLIEASLKSLVQVTPKKLITLIVVFAGVISNVAGELGYIVLVPLGAVIFYGFGKHPLAGLAAAFAGVSGGYSANLLIGTIDPLLAGLSQEAARFIDPSYTVGAEANWYFMVASTFLVTILGTLVTEKIVEPMLGKYDSSQARDKIINEFDSLTALEKKGLKISGLVSLIFFGLLAWSVLPEKGILLDQTTFLLAGSPFLHSIVPFVFLFFSINGIIYGYITKVYNNAEDVIDALVKSMGAMASYIVLAFFMAQFIAYFSYTNLGLFLSVSMANGIKEIGANGSVLMISFIFIAAIANLFMGSASAKWALMAPIFIPMLMLLGYSPEVTQVAYRIGDSTTNIISPLMSYIGIILYAAQRYIKNFGLGNLLSLMLPYSIVFLIFWSVFFYLWVFVFGLPVGPGSPSEFIMGGK